MDPRSKEDISKAFGAKHKDEILKILKRNGIQKDVDSLPEVESLFFFDKKTTEVRESTVFVCGRCKSNKIVLRQEQTRATDEGVTSILRCNDCGNTWYE